MYKLKNVLPEYILLILYNALISSHLNYGLTVWRIKADRLEITEESSSYCNLKQYHSTY